MTPSRALTIAAVAAPHVPDFDLVRPIGKGGFGQVWLAINRTTGQPRAVKLIPRHRVGSPDPAGREIASLVRLEANQRCRHPNLLTIHHVGETADYLFYVMELADDLSCVGSGSAVEAKTPSDEGRHDSAGFSSAAVHANYRPATLENRLADGPLDATECEHIAHQLLAALACLHEAGMVHRDVKPANCLFLGGELKLGDFGLLTSANLDISRVGTLRYMPPDGCMDARADVYAAGLVIYEMLTGLPSERFPSLGDRARQTAEDSRLARLNRLALRACDPDPKRRFRDAREMLLAARQQPARSHRLRRLMLAVGVLIGAASVFFWLHRPPPVGVNFVTEPYEAMIYLDGQLLRAPDGAPYRTPCTVHGHVGGSHRIVFQWDPFDPPVIDGKFDAGIVDLTENRQIIVIARPKTE